MTGPLDFPVTGMTCAACATRVAKVLNREAGVALAEVNFATGRAQVRLAAGAELSVGDLRRAVQGAGYDVPRGAGREGADEAATEEADLLRERRLWSRRAGLALALTAPVVLGVMVPNPWSHAPQWPWVAALLASTAVLGPGLVFHRRAVLGLLHRAATMDTLVSLGSVVALAQAWGHLLAGDHEAVHAFEGAASLVTFLLLGRLLEHRARGRASRAIRDLLAFRPTIARVLRGDDREEPIPAAQVEVGDRFRVPPGERVPADGIVESGRSAVLEAALTGESTPVTRGPGDPVLGGTVTADGALLVRATRPGAASAIEEVIRLVREAQGQQAPIQRLADRVAAVFVPAVLVVATVGGIVWAVTTGDAGVGWSRFATVVVVACPCALGLATPISVLVGTGSAARRGVLFRHGPALEAGAAVDTVAFDKTGTLTRGRPELDAHDIPEDVLPQILPVLAASRHPLSQAIVAALGPGHASPTELREEPGLGVAAQVEGVEVKIGHPAWVEGDRAPDPSGNPPSGEDHAAMSVVACAVAGQAVGRFWLRDQPRPEAQALVNRLRGLGYELHLWSGDREEVVAGLARELGIDAANASGRLRPAEKLGRLRSLQQRGRRVAFVGDGVNDAPVLAAADLGIALSSGTAIAMEAAPVCVLGGNPAGALLALDIARATLRNVRQNLVWAMGYNLVMVPAALGLLRPFDLSPHWAGLAMGLSSVSVVLNSLRLRWWSSA